MPTLACACRSIKAYSGRASKLRVFDLAMSFDSIKCIVNGLNNYVCRFHKLGNSTHDRSEHEAANKVQKSVFGELQRTWQAAAQLQAADDHGAFGQGSSLPDKHRKELLGFAAIGEKRAGAHIDFYVIQPPLGRRPDKNKLTSLHTFALKAARPGKRQHSLLVGLQKRYNTTVERVRCMLVQPMSVWNSPQAISKPDGSFPSRAKSEARAELLQGLSHTGDFTNKTNQRGALNTEALDTARPLDLVRLGPTFLPAWCAAQPNATTAAKFATVVDGLSIVHKPPVSHAKTFKGWYEHMASTGISGHLKNGSSTVVFIIDRPDDLPPPREVLHAKRADASKRPSKQPPTTINMDGQLPNQQELSNWLTHRTFKQALVQNFTQYLTSGQAKYRSIMRPGQTVVVDSSATGPQPWAAMCNTAGDVAELPANHTLRTAHTQGEADLSAWHFAHRVSEEVVVFEAADTDWFFYGLALLEASPTLQGKQLLVHHVAGSQTPVHHYEHLNVILQQLREKVQDMDINMQHPAAQLLFVYLLSGTDYIPASKFVTFMAWWVHLLQHYSFIVDPLTVQPDPVDDQLLPLHEAEPIVALSTNQTGQVELTINEDSAARLISSWYYLSAERKGPLCTNASAWPMQDVYREVVASETPDCAIQDALETLYSKKPVLQQGSILTWLDLVHHHSFTKEKGGKTPLSPLPLLCCSRSGAVHT